MPGRAATLFYFFFFFFFFFFVVTEPRLSRLFGRRTARQVSQASNARDRDEVWEFGACSGALAAESCSARSVTSPPRTRSSRCRAVRRAQGREAKRAFRRPHPAGSTRLPEDDDGVVVENEVLGRDAGRVAELRHGRHGGARGVGRAEGEAFDWPTADEWDAKRGEPRSTPQHERAACEAAGVRPRATLDDARARRDLSRRTASRGSGLTTAACGGT